MDTGLLIAFAASSFFALVVTPLVIALAPRIGAMDRPSSRKVHKVPTPRLGGVSIFLSFFLSLLTLLVLDPTSLAMTWLSRQEGLALLGCLLAIVLLGVWDDIRELKASHKFLVQFVLANIIYFAGLRISHVTHPFDREMLYLGLFQYPVTILWIVGITNAFNLIDGLDGLAAGVATIAFLVIGPISFINGHTASGVIALLVAGSLLGFLRYNFNPARIFLGDSGSLFLGLLLSVLSLQSSTKGTATFAIMIPMLALGLPIMDTLLAMIRRFLRSFQPEEQKSSSLVGRLKSMFVPDKSHIHHRLLARGMSQRKVVLMLYLISCTLGLGAFAVTIFNNFAASIILGIAGMAIIIGVRQLKYKEMEVLKSGVLLPLYEKPIFNHDSFRAFFDIAFMVISCYLANGLTAAVAGVTLVSKAPLTDTLIVIGLQFSVFVLMGGYRGSFRIIGIDDVLKVIKSVGTAVLVSTVFLLLRQTSRSGMDLFVQSLLNFFLLLTLVTMFRASFRVLQHLYHKETKGGRRILLYGADMNGMWMLDKILQMNYATIVPVGFIDDNPYLEGKKINGYPVFGGHWKLARLTQRMKIDEIVVCSDTIKPEILRRIRQYCREAKIQLTKSRLLFEDFGHSQETPATEFVRGEAVTSSDALDLVPSYKEQYSLTG